MNDKATVFLVDDNPENVTVLIDYLKKRSMDVTPLYSGEELLEAIKKQAPDIILLDIMMDDGIDGFETCRRLKEDEATWDIPVIFMSARTESIDKVKGFNLGAVDYIAKPIHGAELLSRLTTHLTINKLQKELRIANTKLEEKVLERTRELSKTNKALTLAVKDHEQAREKLSQAKEAAEAANNIKDQIMRNISHEFRTPLNGIMGMMSLLSDTELSDEQADYLENLKLSADDLLALVDDLLDLSKIEAGKLEVAAKPFNVRRLTDRIVLLFRSPAQKKGIPFTAEIDPSLQGDFIGDPFKVQQVIVNLADNALKFTEKGSVQITVKAVSQTGDRTTLAFTVSDTGIGIPASQITAIFNSFMQLDGGYSRRYGGIGLGLTIVKGLVELMKGTIRVESEVDKGSRFIIELPFNKAAPQTGEPDAAPAAIKTVQQRRDSRAPCILVAEDEGINRKYISQFLELNGYRVEEAADGRQVLEMLEAKKIDLVLMDIGMPVLNGLDAAIQIRKKEENTARHIPILALTAHVHMEDIENYRHAGLDGVISKPVDETKLLAGIEAQLK